MHRTEGDPNVDFQGAFTLEDFDFSFEWGLRVAGEVRFGGDGSLESVFTGFHRWSDVVIVDLGTGIGTGGYQSELYGGEVNSWYPIHWPFRHARGAVMAGGRYLNLRETFSFENTTPGGLSNFIETDNHVVVGQLGWMLSGNLRRTLGVRWEGKAGLGANHMERETVQLAPTVFDQEGNDSTLAFIGETSVVISYQVVPSLSVYAGYYAMWVDGLALAPAQFNIPPEAIDDDSRLFFQAGIAGVEATW